MQTNDNLHVFRRILLDRRTNKGYSVREIADKIGIGRNQYHEIETGKRQPSVQSLIKISKFFNISLDYALLAICMKGQEWK